MNQMNTKKRQPVGIALLIRYVVLLGFLLTGAILAVEFFVEKTLEADMQEAMDKNFVIADIQIAAQINDMVGDAIHLGGTTREIIGYSDELSEEVQTTLKAVYNNMISDTGKYTCISFHHVDGDIIQGSESVIVAGDDNEITISQDMANTYEKTSGKQPSLAYITDPYYSEDLGEIIFDISIPYYDKKDVFKGYITVQAKYSIIAKEIQDALSVDNLSYELVKISEKKEVFYVYSGEDLDKVRGGKALDTGATEVGTNNSGKFKKDENMVFFRSIVMPISNYNGPKHDYVVGNDELTLFIEMPIEDYKEVTTIAHGVTLMLHTSMTILGILVSILLYIMEGNRRKFTVKTTKMAQLDTLTGLLNRAYFTELFEKRIDENPETKYAVLFMDLDGFKLINDTYGHDTGDKVLKVVANRLVMTARRDDLVGRFGGDEFAMAVTYSSIDQIKYIGNKVVTTIGEDMNIDNNTYNVGISIGIAMYPDHAKTVADLYKVSDNAMYKVKYSTKGSYWISKGDESEVNKN